MESVIEVLLTKTKADEKLKDEPLVLSADVQTYLSGNTISYLEFIFKLLRTSEFT